jgi:signal transduction histidine kinase
VNIAAVNGHLSLLVRDDGTGQGAAVGHGQGLTNLHGRVEALGGRFRVDGRPGGGTSVSATCRSGQTMPDPLRIVLAEDNYLVREGTRRLLEDSGEVDAVGNAKDLRDAVRRFALHKQY